MAIRWAVSNGNWSNSATWNGGTLPQAGDDVYADNKTITIDQSITVNRLNTSQRSGGTAGGAFNVTIGGLTINSIINAGTTVCLTDSHNSGINAYNGNKVGGSANYSYGMNITGTGIFTFNGNCVGGTAPAAHGVLVNGNAQITMTGNCVGGTYSSSGLSTNYGSVDITGNIYAGTTNSGVYGLFQQLTATIVVHGDVYASTTAYAIYQGGAGTITVYGKLYVSSNVNMQVCSNNGTGGVITVIGDQQQQNGTLIMNNASGVNSTVNILGNITGSNTYNYPVVVNASTGTVNITGNVGGVGVQTSGGNYLISNSSTGTLNITGNVIGGSVLGSRTIVNGNNGNIYVTGNVTGGSGSDGYAIYSVGNGIIDIAGSITRGNCEAVYSAGNGTNNFRGNMYCVGGKLPMYCPNGFRISDTQPQSIIFQDINGNNRYFGTSNAVAGQPSVSDVRYGVTFGLSSEFTGTAHIPSPANVTKNIPVDNTVGTAILTESQLAAIVQANAQAPTAAENAMAVASVLPSLSQIVDSLPTLIEIVEAIQNNVPTSDTNAQAVAELLPNLIQIKQSIAEIVGEQLTGF